MDGVGFNTLMYCIPVDSLKSLLCGMDDVLLLILVLRHVRNKNQPGATFAPSRKMFYGPKEMAAYRIFEIP